MVTGGVMCSNFDVAILVTTRARSSSLYALHIVQVSLRNAVTLQISSELQ